MLKLNKDQHRQPIGGHQFPQNGHIIRADTFDQLRDKVSSYRLTNHIPMGDPEQEILVHYAKHWPWMVKQDRDSSPKRESPEYVRYRRWIEETWRRPPMKMVTTKQAEDRWAVCEKCPFNIKEDWESTKETTELARRAYLLRKGMPVSKKLGNCALHFYANLAVLSYIEAPANFVDQPKDKTKPEGCWIE